MTGGAGKGGKGERRGAGSLPVPGGGRRGGPGTAHVSGHRCLWSPVLETAWQQFPRGAEGVVGNVGNLVSLGRRAGLVSRGQA